MSSTATPHAARDHARAQAGRMVEAMPTIPASAARDLPPHIASTDVLWDETLAAGGYASRVLKRGSRLRLVNTKGDACANVLVYNADHPIERLNLADTVKVQWNAYLGAGKLLLSDMGRVLMSIIEDTSGHHDALCGASNQAFNQKKYGHGATYGPHPNARDRFLLALAKHGLGLADIMPNVNFFKGVRVAENGALVFQDRPHKPGEVLELRAEMNILVVIANTPHVLDPRPAYLATNLRITAYRGPIAPVDDPVRNSTPEALRAFQNVEDYYLA